MEKQPSIVHSGDTMSSARRSLVVLAALCLTLQANAQESAARAEVGVLGLSLTLSGTGRDTLGMLVASVVPGGPADRAGVAQGNRVADIAGVSLRVDPADLGLRGLDEQIARRLSRAVRTVQSADQFSMLIVSGTREQTVRVQSGNGLSSEKVVAGTHRGIPVTETPSAAPLTASTSPSAADASSEQSTASAASVPSVTDAIEQQRLLLRKLARGEEVDERSDSLLNIERDLRSIVRRLHELQAPPEKQQTAAESSAPAVAPTTVPVTAPVSASPDAPAAAANDSTLPGLRVAPVGANLQAYFGDGSEGGLLVLAADSAWSPVQNGDVILRIDGRNVDVMGLRAALAGTDPVAIEVLRKRRRMILTMHGSE